MDNNIGWGDCMDMKVTNGVNAYQRVASVNQITKSNRGDKIASEKEETVQDEVLISQLIFPTLLMI